MKGAFEIGAPVQPLAARCDLQAVEEKVESRRARPRQRVRIEGPGRERKSEHEHGWNAALPLDEPAQLPLGIRVEISNRFVPPSVPLATILDDTISVNRRDDR
jgi:hypothetical protein